MDRILEWSQSRTQQFHWALGTAEPEASTEHGTAERENEWKSKHDDKQTNIIPSRNATDMAVILRVTKDGNREPLPDFQIYQNRMTPITSIPFIKVWNFLTIAHCKTSCVYAAGNLHINWLQFKLLQRVKCCKTAMKKHHRIIVGSCWCRTVCFSFEKKKWPKTGTVSRNKWWYSVLWIKVIFFQENEQC